MREPRLQGTGWPTPGVPADRQMRPVWLLSGRDSPMRPEPLPTASPQARRWDSCSGETALALRGAASCRSKCPEPSLAHSLTALKQPPLCVQTVWSLQRLYLELRLKSLSGRKFVFPGPGLARPAERRLPASYSHDVQLPPMEGRSGYLEVLLFKWGDGSGPRDTQSYSTSLEASPRQPLYSSGSIVQNGAAPVEGSVVAMMWVNPENVMLSERSRAGKVTSCTSPRT